MAELVNAFEMSPNSVAARTDNVAGSVSVKADARTSASASAAASTKASTVTAPAVVPGTVMDLTVSAAPASAPADPAPTSAAPAANWSCTDARSGGGDSGDIGCGRGGPLASRRLLWQRRGM